MINFLPNAKEVLLIHFGFGLPISFRSVYIFLAMLQFLENASLLLALLLQYDVKQNLYRIIIGDDCQSIL